MTGQLGEDLTQHGGGSVVAAPIDVEKQIA